MKIKKLVIKNYKKYRDISIELNSGVNIFVGDNNSGKSTILEAISMVLTGKINGIPITNKLLVNNKKVIQTQRYFLKYFKKYIGRTHTDTKFKNNLLISIFCNSQNVNWGHKSIQYYKPHSVFCGVFCFCEFGKKYEKISLQTSYRHHAGIKFFMLKYSK
jgi:hypothetical protein